MIVKAESVAWKDPKGRQCTDSSTIPNYLSDLNAMHEAEKVLRATGLFPQYRAELFVKAGDNPMWHATAAQRAEAFLRTIGKWEED